MVASPSRKRNPVETRAKLLAATVGLMLRQGFNATSVDQICADAGVTKGSFFHYFESKEEVGLAAVNWWGQMGTDLYSEAWKNPDEDGLEQFHRFLDIMSGLTERPDQPCICMVGMFSQEMAMGNAAMREACSAHLATWSGFVVTMLDKAKRVHPPVVEFDSKSIAWCLNSLWQGSMMVTKAHQRQAMIAENIELARQFVDGLFFGLPGAPKMGLTVKPLN